MKKKNPGKAEEPEDRKRPLSASEAASAGKGSVVGRIISLAQKNGVPIHEDRNLIAILSTLDFYEEIPAELYKAVAEILVYIHRQSGKM